ncbi:hypothetical protein NIES4071_49440 [Calothrix sp. NIES-4071]|nr:hypothetical protein NIES4071_49440 [Calothrix sp. NIES-4071]BAZ59251.1 hypothetical protein NIES4105_49380 [Calothrix sp. NIES-4105]
MLYLRVLLFVVEVLPRELLYLAILAVQQFEQSVLDFARPNNDQKAQVKLLKYIFLRLD